MPETHKRPVCFQCNQEMKPGQMAIVTSFGLMIENSNGEVVFDPRYKHDNCPEYIEESR